MSAAQPKIPEPSMEEILASIRRIIADEPQKAAPAQQPKAVAQPEAAPAAPPEDDEILELTPKKKVVEPHFISDDPVDNDLSFSDPIDPPKPKSQDDIDALMTGGFEAPVVQPPAPVQAPTPTPTPAAVLAETAPPVVQTPAMMPPSETRLLSSEADRAASSAFSSLATTILSKNARTLEDLMQDMMRPMVKSWLDDNLPTVVERLVKAEIERVSRGGR